MKGVQAVIVLSFLISYVSYIKAQECCGKTTFQPVKNNCSQYYDCSTSLTTPELKSCPAGTYFNCFNHNCSTNPWLTCCMDDPNAPDVVDYSCSDYGYQVINPFYCGLYFVCADGQILDGQCNYGQDFSSCSGCVTAAANSDCAATTTTSTTTPATTSTSVTTTTTGPTTTSTSATTTTTEPTTTSTSASTTTTTTSATTTTTAAPTTTTTTQDTTTSTSASTTTGGSTTTGTTTTTAAGGSITVIVGGPTTGGSISNDTTTTTTTASSTPIVIGGPTTPAPTTTTTTTQATPTTALTIGALCPNDSIAYNDAYDCQSKYQCSGGQLHKFTCANGQYYHCLKKACYGTQYRKCCPYANNQPLITDETCVQPGNRAPNPSDCLSYFECGASYRISVINCPSGQRFDFKTNQCMVNGNCYPLIRSTAPTTTSAPISGFVPQCSQDGARTNNVNFCNGFFQCSGGRRQYRMCGIGQTYDCFTNKCVSSWTGKSACCRQTVPQSFFRFIFFWRKDTCSTNGATTADPLGCSTYYLCENGKPVKKTCPDGTKFDSWQRTCLSSSQARCGSNMF